MGSIVQKGKFSAGMPIFVSTLNSVLFPTFGSPTIPIYIVQDKIQWWYVAHWLLKQLKPSNNHVKKFADVPSDAI